MASTPRNVDLGPLYLQVGEGNESPNWTPPASDANVSDVDRFQSILGRTRGNRQQADEAADLLPGPLRAPEAALLAEPEDICDEIAHLWVGTGVQSAREVRVRLREALLPDTSVRLCESGGCLSIEFTCASSRVADWLDRKLPALAQELGARLRRPLELTIVMADGARIGARSWSQAQA